MFPIKLVLLVIFNEVIFKGLFYVKKSNLIRYTDN